MSQSRPGNETKYRVAPPDVLSITVRPDPGIEREVTVRPDGNISFELIGDLEVEGRTIDEISDEITARIARYLVKPLVTVSLVSSNSRRIFVLGQVRRPGAYPLIGRVTAVEALATAGDANVLAAPNRSRLVRPGSEGETVFSVRFDDIIAGDASTNYWLEPGDVVYVPPGTGATIGFALHALLFPLQQIVGLGSPAAAAAY